MWFARCTSLTQISPAAESCLTELGLRPKLDEIVKFNGGKNVSEELNLDYLCSER